MKKIAIVGCKGKMGSLIANALDKNYQIVGIDKENCLDNFDDLNLVIDFANGQSSVLSAEFCLKKQIPLIIGSTGQTAEENKRICEISKSIKIIKKSNFSKGIGVLKTFVEEVLKLHPEKFEIIEKHHKNKKDSPSGTAKELESFIKERFNGKFEIKSIREGEEMGEHTIIAYARDEKLTITHNVYSRSMFVDGVVEDVKNLLD